MKFHWFEILTICCLIVSAITMFRVIVATSLEEMVNVFYPILIVAVVHPIATVIAHHTE